MNGLLKGMIGVGFMVLTISNSWADVKGITATVIKTPSGESIGHYKNSYALLVGISNYRAGWPDLESIPGELDVLETTLKNKGFQIVRVNNPDAEALEFAFKNFVDAYGYDPENRLMFFYSGHGHTMDSGRKGYLVPTDAPHPEKNPRLFKRKALDMGQIIAWARQMDAKHGLFLFDSCFSGTIFKQKNLLPTQAPPITQWTSLPVRQFITAGSAGETVPANSTFTPAVVDAINGKADMNGDGYVIGTELGLFLQSEVPRYVNQTPQYGKIQDYELSRGDFVFFTPKVLQVVESEPEVTSEPGLSTRTSPVELVIENQVQGAAEQQAKVDLELPEIGGDDSKTTSPESMTAPKKRPWYKNPWFWAGTIAATAGAAYALQNNDDNPQGGVVLE